MKNGAGGPEEPPGPLDGVRVLDFTRILAGPYCTLLLADMGADVIKVERCERGDDTRAWGPPFLDDEQRLSTYFAALNRGKRSVTVDFRAPETRGFLLDLCAEVDVVIENFRPGVARELGLTYEALEARSPTIVLCSISGFGHSGPYANLPGTEIVVEAMSGLMEITGTGDGDPVRFGIAMVDIATGLTAATRIVASILAARATGRGAHVECDLYSTALAALGTPIAAYSATGLEPRRWGSHHPSIVPYGGFPTADGHIITGVVNDRQWPIFCDALELGHLAMDQRYATNAARVLQRDDLQATLAERCAQRPTAHWLDRLRHRGLLAAPLRTVGEAVEDQLAGGGQNLVALEGFPDAYSTRLDGTGGHIGPQRVPALGEDTRAVLEELLELGGEQIDELARAGTITGRRAW
jgi:crotonobetainyl-CoA:carnitine CoA-transferase CaiB-like acyl-CoA transferase